MKPWELSTTANNEEYLLREWARLKTTDFYFASVSDGGRNTPHATVMPPTTAYLTPTKFFLEHEHMYRESMPISHLIPKGLLIERLPSVFYSLSLRYEVTNALYNAGFVFSSKFQTFAEVLHNELVKSNQC